MLPLTKPPTRDHLAMFCSRITASCLPGQLARDCMPLFTGMIGTARPEGMREPQMARVWRALRGHVVQSSSFKARCRGLQMSCPMPHSSPLVDLRGEFTQLESLTSISVLGWVVSPQKSCPPRSSECGLHSEIRSLQMECKMRLYWIRAGSLPMMGIILRTETDT